MNGWQRRAIASGVALVGLAAFLVAACAAGAPMASSDPGTSFPTAVASPVVAASAVSDEPTPPVDTAIEPVSASKPSAEAKEVWAKCQIGEQIPLENVTSMGRIESAKDLAHYVSLTGREPQLKEAGPAWVVTVKAEVPQPGSTELWTDPTCVVTGGDSGYFATGPVTDLATGKVLTPEAPARPADRGLPPLAP